jgi:hypothetical protein
LITINNLKDWFVKTEINVLPYKKIIDNITKQMTSNKEGVSTQGKDSKQFYIENSQELNPIVQDIKKVINTSLKDFDLKLLSAWTVYGEKYGFHKIHRHNHENNNHLATVLFLDVPKIVEPDLCGNLFFITRDKYNNLEYKEFSPKIGDFFIFPIHVLHGTYPQSEGIRQTLNLDFEVLC